MIPVVQAAVSGTTYGYDKLYRYRVPQDWILKTKKGMRVLVPFGKGNQKRIALLMEDVTEISASEADTGKLKPILSVVDEAPLLDEEMLGLVEWLKDFTFCTYFDAFKCLIPTGLHVSFTQKYRLTGQTSCHLSKEEEVLFQFLSASKNMREFDRLLDTAANPDKLPIVRGLLEKGVIAESNSLKRRVRDESVRMLRLSEEYLQQTVDYTAVTPKQKKVVELLLSNGTASVKEVCYLCNVTGAVISSLFKKNVLVEYQYEVVRPSTAEATEQMGDLVLSPQQQQVFEGLAEMVRQRQPQGALLHGVTGSGKTSVFLKLISYTLNSGRQAMMLVPEIALTPQMVRRFQSLFGAAVAVMHSNLSLTQRMNEYKRIRSGQATIVVGTRSAVFAPLSNIGLIIMDEEGERTYKSESSPRYHARDAAKKRCAYHRAVLLMASATPSIESYCFAQMGHYRLFELTERYTQTPLPEVTVVDMAEEAPGNHLSEILRTEIRYNLEHGEQSILLLNRRGYHTYMSCPQCRVPLSCPECQVPLTYHKINNQLICHYCGYTRPMDTHCPSCGCEHLQCSGTGTQRVEEELENLYPDAKILRMDMDTTSSRFSYEKNFTAFRNQEYDIMIGTQMIAKGLDFPNVTLVGVISLDKVLFSGDFRSYERTFSLITQVVGRGGRGEKRGRAFLQTYVPEHYVLNLAARQDYRQFYQEEISVRKALTYPPFCDICVFELSTAAEHSGERASGALVELLRRHIEQEKITFPLKILGPVKDTYGRIHGKYRWHLLMKCRNTREFRTFISGILTEISKMKEFSAVSVSVDMNGDSGI